MRDTGVRRVRSLVLGLSLVISIFILSFYLSEKHGIVNAQTKDSCVTDKCHSKMGKEKFVHGPAAVETAWHAMQGMPANTDHRRQAINLHP